MKTVLWIAVFLLGSCLAGCKHTQSTTRIVIEARKMPTTQYEHVPHMSALVAPEFSARLETEIFATR